MIDHGIFEEYRPAGDDPILIELPAARFCRNAGGEDWYVYQQQLLIGPMKLLVGVDGRIAGASRDAGSLFPAGFRLVEIETDADPDSLRRCLLVDGQVVAPPAPVLTRISDRQFAQQLAVLGTITEAEALAWAARGELPDAMEAAIAALPEGDRFGARMLLASATTYERAHPLVAQLGALLAYDDADLDDLWRAAALL